MNSEYNIAERYMMRALDLADVNYEQEGIDANMNWWHDNKLPLVELLAKSKHWNPHVLALEKVVEFEATEDDQRASDRLHDLMRALFAKMPEDEQNRCMHPGTIAVLVRRGSPMHTLATARLLRKSVVQTDDDASFLKGELGYDRIQKGMKVSRLVQKVIEKNFPGAMEDKYVANAYYAWVDSISPKKQKRRFVLSANPADYLLMSYGNDWASCHIINPEMARGSGDYSGCYRAGTLSYMNDAVTLIAYMVPESVPVEDVPLEPKIARQCVFMRPDSASFFQSRMYPLGCDGYMDTVFENILKDMLGDLLGVRQWGDGHLDSVRTAGGLHYRDYSSYAEQCAAFVSLDDNAEIHENYAVGHDPFCLLCGDVISESNTLLCEDCDSREHVYECRNCGDGICGDEVIWIDDEPYCEDCVPVCNRCGSYVGADDVRYIGGEHYCPFCAEDVVECAHCGDAFDRDYAVETAEGDMLCANCASLLDTCRVCGAPMRDEAFEGACVSCVSAFGEQVLLRDEQPIGA